MADINIPDTMSRENKLHSQKNTCNFLNIYKILPTLTEVTLVVETWSTLLVNDCKGAGRNVLTARRGWCFD